MEAIKKFSYKEMLRKKTNKMLRLMGILVILLAVFFIISMNLGASRLSPIEIARTLLGAGTARQSLILFEFRLPRIVMAILIGAGLAVSGAILQGISRNPLADPGILGINAGAGLGVVVFMMFFTQAAGKSIYLMPIVALVGGFAAATLIYLFSIKRGSVSPIRMILVGIGMGLLFNALILLILLRMDYRQYMKASIWMTGSIWGTDWRFVVALLPWILILLPYAYIKSSILNVMNLGEENATGLGMRIERERLLLSATAVALASSCVAIGGGISFVGLVAPHLSRQLVGPRHQHLLPITALLGALLLLVADILARQLLAPMELPVGITIAVIGAPYFLYLLVKSNV